MHVATVCWRDNGTGSKGQRLKVKITKCTSNNILMN